MRDDERFEIERAYDLLPHVVGASLASTWFRLNQIKKPTEEEFRKKTVEFFATVEKLGDVYPVESQFSDMKSYMNHRYNEEIEKIMQGKNPEIEKRYKRYIDYG
jgi:hypothetical protein